MAATADKSIQVTAGANGQPKDSVDYKGELVPFKVDFTQGAAAGDANSTADLIVLPPGKWRYISWLSKLSTSAFGASRTLDIGHTGYTEPDGDAVAADEDSIDSAKDVSSAVSQYSPGDELTADGTISYNSKTPILIQAKCEGGTLPAAATIKGVLMFMR